MLIDVCDMVFSGVAGSLSKANGTIYDGMLEDLDEKDRMTSMATVCRIYLHNAFPLNVNSTPASAPR